MSTSVKAKPPIKHTITVHYERDGYLLHGGHRAHCACGWFSDCYAMMSDTERAIEVHLRRTASFDLGALSLSGWHPRKNACSK